MKAGGSLFAGESEVGQAQAPLAVEQDVGRFDVAVDDAGLVGRGERGAQVRKHTQGDAFGDGASAFEPCLQGLAVDQFHDEKRATPFLAEVEHADQRRVVEPRGDSGLPTEPFEESLGAVEGGGVPHDLHRHGDVEGEVVGLPDHPHGTLADFPFQPATSEDPAGLSG